MIQIKEIFEQGGLLSSCIDRFEPRQGQLVMAEAIEDLLSGHTGMTGQGCRILVVEAETGIGKTLAYLIPAVLSGQRVVVSTATLNLQDQIYKKDIPLVENVVQQKISALCVKGRENYLCLYRWFQYRSGPQLSLVEDPWVEKVDSWLDRTETGDRAELPWLQDKSKIWNKISSASSQCLGGECPEGSHCFINRLRKKAGNAQLLVVNHHLFFSDLALKKRGYGELLPRYQAVIFDEAHHLEVTASNFFGRSFSQYQVIDFLADIERQAQLDLQPDQVDELLAACGGLRQRGDNFYHSFPLETGRFHLEPFIEKLGGEEWSGRVGLLAEGIRRFVSGLHRYTVFGEGWQNFIERGTELEENLREIALREGSTESGLVHWYEKRERSVAICATPINIAEILREDLYGRVEACVLTSATLSTGNSFSYVSERLGLDEGTRFLQLPSPFDYRNRTLLYLVGGDFPEPNSPDFQDAVNRQVLEIVRLSRGRALVLCTSFRNMLSLADHIAANLDHPVLVQGTASRQALLETFREQTDSVLFAVASFWEGVDIVGESLSCVVIDKLPFEVPSDPVIQARIEQVRQQGGKPFFDFQVPRAILALRQGVGRLMRSAGDSGVIAIMDSRLKKKGYGSLFLRSLPPSPRCHSLAEVAAFYDSDDGYARDLEPSAGKM